MFTGDNFETAKAVAESLCVDEFYCEMLPEDKVNKLTDIQKQFSSLAFVGDGINDAPVLSTVDVGISMGSLGSDVAVKASDVVILTDEPSKVTKAIEIARRTHSIVMQNVVFAIIVKLVVLILSAFGLGFMFLAVFADVGVAIIAVLNALRALKLPQKKIKTNKFKPVKALAKKGA